MRSSGLIFVISIVSILLIDSIFYYQLRSLLHKKWEHYLLKWHPVIFILLFVGGFGLMSRIKGPDYYFWIEIIIGIMFLVYTPKLIFILFNGIGRITQKFNERAGKIISFGSYLLSGLIFLLLLFSITFGRYNYKIDKVDISLDNLPPSFTDLRIVQLSDLHLGSYGRNYPGISKLVKEVNNLHPDIIVFTGDMVNNFATEMTPWIPVLKELKAKYGKYAVTGNHDYGDYTHWTEPAMKQENLNLFFNNMKNMGFHMLNNTHEPIIIDQDTIYLAGVENWGKPPFPKYGRLMDAIEGSGNKITILLSHDPSHWRGEVLEQKIPLTLSGHTHAMQMGIKIGRWIWTPAKYLYPEYDGLYKEGNHHLYVNRGQGYLGFPGRIGLRPVITEITLKPVTQN